MIRRYFTKENLVVLVLALIALHPVIDLDYLLASFFDSIGMPRLSVIIDYLLLPFLAILTFILFEKRKKRIAIFAIIYGAVLALYFIVHCLYVNDALATIDLPDNFYFNIFYEFAYLLSLVIPLAYIYVIYLSDVKMRLFKKVSLTIASIMGLSIFISNIFEFGLTTYNYENQINGNIFSWFSMPYDFEENLAKFYPTKFYFEEGNTTGIIMFLNAPFIFYFFIKEDDKIKKVLLGGLVLIHSLAMMIVSTRVSTYGAVAIASMVLVVYLFLVIIKKEKFKTFSVLFIVAIIALTAFIIPYSPAYNMPKVFTTVYGESDLSIDKGAIYAEIVEGAQGLDEDSDEWKEYYLDYLKEYHFMLNGTPEEYYLEYYPESYDPEFWVRTMFTKTADELNDGRVIQMAIIDEKWQRLDPIAKGLGLGYTTLMNGSVLIERDFVRQYYSLGYIGMFMAMVPWLISWLYLGFKMLFGYKKGYWNFFDILLMASFTLAIIVSLLSGHTFDQFSSALYIALVVGMLFRDLGASHEA